MSEKGLGKSAVFPAEGLKSRKIPAPQLPQTQKAHPARPLRSSKNGGGCLRGGCRMVTTHSFSRAPKEVLLMSVLKLGSVETAL